MVGDRLHPVGQVQKGKVRKHGMGGKNGGGKHGSLHAHGGDDRQSDSEGAFSDTGNVLDGNDAFHSDKNPLSVSWIQERLRRSCRGTAGHEVLYCLKCLRSAGGYDFQQRKSAESCTILPA